MNYVLSSAKWFEEAHTEDEMLNGTWQEEKALLGARLLAMMHGVPQSDIYKLQTLRADCF